MPETKRYYSPMAEQWMDQSTKIRAGEELDVQKLETYLLEKLPDANGKLQIEQFPNGFSNLTYLIKLGERQMVLRRPPFGANVKSGHDMSREYRILSQLEGHYPKVPRALLYTDDPEVIGAEFYVMERVAGVILRPKMPAEMIPDQATMAGIAHALIETFVELHAVDYQASGLGELGRPEGYVGRQISGWAKRYTKAKTDEIPEIDKLIQWLDQHQPAESSASLIHNDFKYDNMVLAADDWTKVIAVLDWEMATLGDPLM
ncbi:MAG: phosphotransferase family protein, partial [Bacteroidota bacterium]